MTPMSEERSPTSPSPRWHSMTETKAPKRKNRNQTAETKETAETEATKENTGKFVMVGGGVLIVLLGVALKLFSAGSVSPWKAVVPLYNMAAGFGIDEAPRKWVAVGVTGAVSLLMFVVAYLGYIISQP